MKFTDKTKCANCQYQVESTTCDMFGKQEVQNFCRKNPPTEIGFVKVNLEWACGAFAPIEI